MKVAIYCRLSEEDKNKQSETEDSESIQNQKSMLVQYAIEHQWDIFDIYSDDDYTGADRNRPEFKKLLVDAEKHKFDIILCKTQARFTRELELVEKYIHTLFPVWNIRFISIVDNADTNVKGNKKSRQINGLVNEWYLEDLSENIRSVFEAKQRAGYHIGSFALYGYEKDPNQKGHLIIDEEAEAVVREIFTLFSQGYGKTTIARLLNDKGIPNPTEYKRLKGLRYKQAKSKTSKLWHSYTITKMLVNEIYIGNMVQRRYGSVSYKTKQNKPKPKSEWCIVQNTHEPIIDIQLWEKVQALVKQRAKPFKIGKIGLFARRVKCAHCGYTMRSSKSRGNYYLQCTTRHVSKDACIGSFISVKKLEQTVINELKKLSNEYLDKDEIEQKVEFNNNLQEQKKKLEIELESYQRKITEYAQGIKVLYLDKIKGVITENEYLEFSKDFRTNQERLEKLVLDIQKQLLALDEKMQLGDNRKQIIEQYTNLEKLDRETVDNLVDYIMIYKRIPKTREVPVEIHWNF